MKLKDVKCFCNEFYRRFSALDLHPLQLRYIETEDSVSVALIKHDEAAGIEASVTINCDSVRLLKINCFDRLDSFFTFDTPLELYTNLLTLLLMCCHASGIIISPSEAINTTLGKKIKTWRELVIYICSLSPKEQATIVVQENHQNALKFLKTTFHVDDGMLVTDGFYKCKIKFKDQLELVRAVLDSLCAVLKIHDYIINPFAIEQNP
ncbi:MAG: hypothetical protein FWD47_12650 [Treponema sp.]|nr:hypothetical protein [Treponema sp.]